MTTSSPTKLNTLLRSWPPGAPLSSGDLAARNVSTNLASHYVSVGWLHRLGRGVYLKLNDELALDPALKLLEQKIPGLHIGGKSALDRHGMRQYVSQQPKLRLYGLEAARLPGWFTDKFPAEYHSKSLFRETAESLLHVREFKGYSNAPLVSSPERAFLELLSEVGVRQSLSEAKELAESAHTLRSSVLNELLKSCRSVKTVRLCLMVGNELSLPWIKKLNPSELPIGSAGRWVARSKNGLLVLK